MPKTRGVAKTVDDEIVLKKPRKGAKLKEEVWQTPNGEVVKYSLAYINPRICGKDNGRVLGYDNSHDYHHRHFMGGRPSPLNLKAIRRLPVASTKK